MPWKASDAETYTKAADTATKKRVWASVANGALERCLDKIEGEVTDEQRDKCEASAIRQAKVVAANVKESMGLERVSAEAIEIARALVNGDSQLQEVAVAKGASTRSVANAYLDRLEQELATALQLNEPTSLAEALHNPSYDGTENTDWARVDKTFGAYRDAYYKHSGAAKPEEEVTRVQDAPAAMKRWIASKTLMGNANANTDADLISYPVVNPVTNKLNRAALAAAAQRASQAGDSALQAKATALRQKEFEKETEEADDDLYNMAQKVEDAFHATFSPVDPWSGPYRNEGVFKDHEVLGNSILIRDKDDGKLYGVAYNQAADGSLAFTTKPNWKAVKVSYTFIVSAPGAQQAPAEAWVSGVARDATTDDLAVLTEAEKAAVGAGRRAPVVVDFQILAPGPGNKRDNRYYPADVLARDIHVFESVDVFATDHQDKERSERTKVGKVLKVPVRFTEEKAPVGHVLIYDPAQAEKTRNRADAGELATMECSIFGKGTASKQKIDGTEYSVVESLTEGKYLDLVSKAGAGGKALGLAEYDYGGGKMTDEKKPDAPVEEVEIEEQEGAVPAGEPQPAQVPAAAPAEAPAEKPAEPAAEPESEPEEAAFGEAEIKAALAESKLPEFVTAALQAATYADEAAFNEAVKKATAGVKQLTGSGEVSGLGASRPQTAESIEEAEKRSTDRFNVVMREHGLAEVPVQQ